MRLNLHCFKVGIKIFLIFFYLIMTLLLLYCCSSDIANRYYGSVRYTPKDPKDVEILWKRPSREFIVIADFQSRGETPEDLRNRAAKIGADAVIVVILGGLYALNEEWAGEDKYKKTYSRITGTAIKFIKNKEDIP